MTLIFMFPFMSLFLFVLFIFLSFLRSTRVFPLLLRIPQFVIRKSDLRSSLRTKCLVKLLLSILHDMFLFKRSFKVLDHLNKLSILLKREKT